VFPQLFSTVEVETQIENKEQSQTRRDNGEEKHPSKDGTGEFGRGKGGKRGENLE